MSDEKESPIKDSLLHLRGTNKKLCIAMVGIPARGKTYIAKKICRYMNWIGYKTSFFSVSDQRRKLYGVQNQSHFFNPANEEYMKQRMESATCALKNMFKFFDEGGQAAIYDGTNVTQKTRDMVTNMCDQHSKDIELIWVECVCKDQSVVNDYIQVICKASPDYVGFTPEEAERDFRKKIAHYEGVYEPIPDDTTLKHVRVVDGGRQLVTNNMRGYLHGRLVSFLLNLQSNKEKTIFVSRHGESEYNRLGKIGGDSSLTSIGRDYGQHLSEFIKSQPEVKAQGIQVWCSTLQRTYQTTGSLQEQAICWHGLREIEVGICDGMTYEEVAEKYPEEFAARKRDKLRYRYPRGESYLDVIARLEPVIFELERQEHPVLVVGHRAVLRCLFAYFLDEPNERIPYLDVPLHSVLRLKPKPFLVDITRFRLGEQIEEKEDGHKKSPPPPTTLITPTPAPTPIPTPSSAPSDSSGSTASIIIPLSIPKASTPTQSVLSPISPGDRQETLVLPASTTSHLQETAAGSLLPVAVRST